MFYTYIIYSETSDHYYTGHTGVDPKVRLRRHNEGCTKSTKSGIPWVLKYCRSYQTKSEAMRREKFIKRQKSRTFIEKLINSDENECRDSLA